VQRFVFELEQSSTNLLDMLTADDQAGVKSL